MSLDLLGYENSSSYYLEITFKANQWSSNLALQKYFMDKTILLTRLHA